MNSSHNVARQRLNMVITLALSAPALAVIPQVAFPTTPAPQPTVFNIHTGLLSRALMEYSRTLYGSLSVSW